MEQAQDFLEESRALHALVAPLSDAEMDQPTAFKGWTINNVIRHLHVWNYAADASLRSEDEFQAFFKEAGKSLAGGGGLRPFEEAYLDGLSGGALVEKWSGYFEDTAGRFAKADPSQRVPWAGPSMSARSSITARLMETWAHGQEVYDQLGQVRKNTDRIKGIVILGVNTYGWTFKTRGEDKPGPLPHLALTAPSGEVWTFGDESHSERIEGAAEEFCQVVTQTRNIADTSLEVTGPIATRWMSIAQCFAGGPETPPAPGTRKTLSPA